MIINVYQAKFHRSIRRIIFFVELHLSQQKLSIIIILYLKITSFGQISNYLAWALSYFAIRFISFRGPLLVLKKLLGRIELKLEKVFAGCFAGLVIFEDIC